MGTCNYCNKNFDSKRIIVGGKCKEYKRCEPCRLRFKEYQKTFISNHGDESQIKYRTKNRKKLNELSAKYRKENIDIIREKDKLMKRKLREENYEEVVRKAREYRGKNIQRLTEKDRNRIENRPEYFLFSSARMRARKMNIEFSITEQDIKELLDKTTVCPLRQVTFQRGKNQKPHDNSPSLDRIDSTKGYTKDNIQIISYKANTSKNTTTLEIYEKIVIGLKNNKIIEHEIDNNTRSIIISDRNEIIKNKNYSREMMSFIRNLENGLVSRARRRAIKNNREFNIDIGYIKSIWPLDNRCPILGEKFIIGSKSTDKYSATLDRIDNKLGYIKGNIQIICGLANSVKNNLTIDELEFILTNWKANL